jgi:hypothetical protein
MAEANRKLNIEVAFKDSLSRPLTAAERNLARFGAFARGSFRALTSAVFNLRTALLSMLAAYSVQPPFPLPRPAPQCILRLG